MSIERSRVRKLDFPNEMVVSTLRVCWNLPSTASPGEGKVYKSNGRNFLIMDGMKMRWYQCLGLSPPENSCSGKWVLFKGLVTCTQYCSFTDESILSLIAMHNIANPRFYLLSLDCVSTALTAKCRKTKFCPLLAASFSWLRGPPSSFWGPPSSLWGPPRSFWGPPSSFWGLEAS